MRNTIIESIGVHLPLESLSTSEVIKQCKNNIRFPLEKITGIKTRPVASHDEFSIDLAKKAVLNCLENSRHGPNDIDLLVCCNISRYDGPRQVWFEPCTAIRLKKHFGFPNALTFDITNACAGMFTGVYIVDALIKSGAIQRAMVVSGEYITHLTRTAQNEIESFMDTRLACLTLGDAGAAIILEEGVGNDTGFQEIDLVTLGAYSRYCTAQVSREPDGEFIMYTDPINLTERGIKYGARHSIAALSRANWKPQDFQQLFMHQTSTMTLNSAQREINSLLKENVCRSENTINNLEYRGNSASTSHFVAMVDSIRNETVNSGDKVVFSIAASGLTVGTALYKIDDLPDRLREKRSLSAALHSNGNSGSNGRIKKKSVRIAGIGKVSNDSKERKDSLYNACEAARHCIDKSGIESRDIGLIIYCGVYRTDYVLEPAYASMIAGELDINAEDLDTSTKTLAFDVFNGAVGFLNACFLAGEMLKTGKCRAAMIVAAEVENNNGCPPDKLMGIAETASAVLLIEDVPGQKGFSDFIFRVNLKAAGSYSTYWTVRNGHHYLHIEKDEFLESHFLSTIAAAVDGLLKKQQIDRSRINWIFPPQISSGFISDLAIAINLPIEKFISVTNNGRDFFSSSLPYALDFAHEKGLVKPGDIGLCIVVGSGIQAGCVLYHF